MLTDLLTWNTWKTPMPKSRSKNAEMQFAIEIGFPLEPGHFWAPDWYFFIVIPLSFFFYFIDAEIENVQEMRMFWKGPCNRSRKIFATGCHYDAFRIFWCISEKKTKEYFKAFYIVSGTLNLIQFPATN